MCKIMDFKELVLHVSVQYPSVFANITADNFSENMPDFMCVNTLTVLLTLPFAQIRLPVFYKYQHKI